MTVEGMVGHAAPEIIEVREHEQLARWQEFELSGMGAHISSMHLCLAVHALSESGILARLRRGERRLPALVEGMDRDTAPAFLEYLRIRGILQVVDDRWWLSRRGELATSDVTLARLGIYVGAYNPVTSNITDLVTGRSRYGVDVHRNGGALGAHCATLFSVFHTPVVARAMRGRGVTRMLDVGCGGGQLVVDACVHDPDLTAVGIDIDADAVDVARELAVERCVADRVTFVVGDAFEPDTWPEICFTADGLCTVSALHEHFRRGEGAVTDILERYVAVLPRQKLFLVGEPELRYDVAENDDDFHLVHILSRQGLPKERRVWLELFERSAVRCRALYHRPGAGPRMCFYDLVPR